MPDDIQSDQGEEFITPIPSPEEEQQRLLVAALTPSDEDYQPFEQSVVQESPVVDEVDEKDPNAPVAFNPKFRDEFEGLLFLGKLQKRFTWLGHTFVIRTLYVNEVLEASLLQKPYIGTMSDMKAYQAAVIAASLVSIDGKPLPIPISSEINDTQVQASFDYINRTWSPLVLDGIFNQYLSLEAKVVEVMTEMGGASG